MFISFGGIFFITSLDEVTMHSNKKGQQFTVVKILKTVLIYQKLTLCEKRNCYFPQLLRSLRSVLFEMSCVPGRPVTSLWRPWRSPASWWWRHFPYRLLLWHLELFFFSWFSRRCFCVQVLFCRTCWTTTGILAICACLPINARVSVNFIY